MHLLHRLGLTPPPTPFLPNTVKDSPGRGLGDICRPATVLTHIVGSECLTFPLFEGGNAVRFFSFCVFCVWFGVFCRFFAVLLFLGSLFENNFGSELLFLGVGVGLVLFGGFLPMFLL